MATNPYTLTYVFAESVTLGVYTGFLRPSGDRVVVTLQFTIDTSGDSATYLASTKRLHINEWGNIKLDYDFDENYLVPAEFNFGVADINGEFAALLYDGALAQYVEKEFYCKVEIKYKNAGSYVTEFSGYNVLDALQYDQFYKKHNFTIIPKTKLLNETFLFQKGYNATAFDASYSYTYPANPLSLVFSGNPIAWNWKYLTKDSGGVTGLIQDIFRLINPSIVIDVQQNWKFWGYDGGTPEIPTYQSSVITFQDLIADGNWIGSVFAENKNSQVHSVGDLLKDLAFSFGCMAGVVSQDKAFFRQMFYDDGAPQTMGTLLKGSHKKKYKYNKVDYVDINSTLYTQDTGNRNRYKKYHDVRGYVAPDDNISGDNGLEKQIVSVAGTILGYINGVFNRAYYLSNLKSLRTGSNFYTILAAKHEHLAFTPEADYYTNRPEPSGFLTLPRLLAEYYYYLKGLFYKTYVHEFVYWGLQYDFLKSFVYDSDVFSMVSIDKNLQTGQTTIEAIKVTDNTLAGEGNSDGAKGGTPELDPLQSEALYNFGAVAKFNYTDFVGTTEKIFSIGSIKQSELLESIEWVITTPFNTAEVQDLRIYDGTGTLLTGTEMDFTEANIDQKRFMKRYVADDTFYIGITPVSSLSAGEGYIVLKKLKRDSKG